MRKKFYLILLGCMTILTSCDTFWETMAQGYGRGGYGMYGGFTPMGYVAPPVVTPPPVTPMTFPAFVPGVDYTSIPVVSSSSSSSSSTTSSSGSSYSSSSSSRDCQRCMGTGKCQTCNGRGYYDEIGIGSGRHACPNCASNHNGKCASCNGSGKM